MTGDEIAKLRGNMPRSAFVKIIGCSVRQLIRWENKGKREVLMLPVFRDRLEVLQRGRGRFK